jgi:hypothetical protein
MGYNENIEPAVSSPFNVVGNFLYSIRRRSEKNATVDKHKLLLSVAGSKSQEEAVSKAVPVHADNASVSGCFQTH